MGSGEEKLAVWGRGIGSGVEDQNEREDDRDRGWKGCSEDSVLSAIQITYITHCFTTY